MMRIFKKYLYITFGVLLITISLEYFFFPNDIAAGGVSGLAIVINKLTGISVGLLMILFNIILFVIAFIFIGGGFGAKSIYATFALSGLLWVFDTFIIPKPFTENYILVVVVGSAIQALGLAIVFNQNASTGGTSIIAKILNKYLHIDIGKSLLLSDFVVTILAIYAFGADKGMFGLISVFLTGTLVDNVIEGFTIAKAVFIISSGSEKVAQFIMSELGRGCTYLDGRGAYTKEKTFMLFTVVNRKQFIVLKNKVREIDANAFITVTDAREVLGEGFRDIDEE
jgi:uncharacterized membrane-anchored protein YitT (DUF2179 family)